MFTYKYYSSNNNYQLAALYFETEAGLSIEVPAKIYAPTLRHQALYYLIDLHNQEEYKKINALLTDIFSRATNQHKEYFLEQEKNGNTIIKIKAFRLSWQTPKLETLKHSSPNYIFLGSSQ